MAVRVSQRANNLTHILANEWQLGASTDTVLISIYDITDNAADVSSAAMTNETGGLFSYSWAVTQNNVYRIDYYNQTLDSHDYEIISVVGNEIISPAAGTGGSTLTTLRSRFLRMIDNYNASDLTGTNSSGDLADLCINDALQLIYSLVKSTRHMESYVSTSFASTSGQDYIEISGITDLDEVRAIRDTTNDYTLIAMTADQYFRWSPDRSNQTGVPTHYCRIFNRIFLFPRPSSAITYSTEYIKIYARLSADSDQALIPSKFDDWILKEARVLWFMMEDPRQMPPIIVSERDQARELYLADMMSGFDLTTRVNSNFDRISTEIGSISGPWDRV